MEEYKRKTGWKKIYSVIAAAGILMAATLGCFAVWQANETAAVSARVEQSEAIQRIYTEMNNEEVKGLFFSMFPLDSYDVNDFLTFRGIPTIMLEEQLSSGEEMLKFLQSVLAKDQSLEAVYLGLSPKETSFMEKVSDKLSEVLWNGDGWEEALLEIVKVNPHIRFHIILEYPSIYQLAELSEDEKKALYGWYQQLAALFTPQGEYQNMVLFLPGAESWLVANKANYLENGQPNEDAAGFALGQMICKDSYALNTGNIAEKLAKIDTMTIEAKTIESLEDGYTYVFFGDSVIGNYTDTLSIPEVIGGYTGADVINCGYGGLAASKKAAEEPGMADIIDDFLAGKYEHYDEEKAIKYGIPAFYEQLSEINTDKLTFFISIGLNDYMSGCPLKGNSDQEITHFQGAVTYAVDRLKEAYPKSEIILMTPNFIGLFEDGTQKINGYVLEDLVNSLCVLSEKLDVKCVDVFHGLNITSKNKGIYLADMCHPNELGRFELGKLVSEHLLNWSKEER